jgi:acyl-CoA synthetase (AMP-forming)/AMP-acid ligase II
LKGAVLRVEERETGVNIYPAEIEKELLDHPAVAEVAIVAPGDETWAKCRSPLSPLVDGETIVPDPVKGTYTGRSGHKALACWYLRNPQFLPESRKVYSKTMAAAAWAQNRCNWDH